MLHRLDRLDRPPARALLASLAWVSLTALFALAGCAAEVSCTAEVTEGAGTFKATAAGTKPEGELKREALRAACGKLCAGKGDACASRCAVDAEAGKIGLRSTCAKGGSR